MAEAVISTLLDVLVGELVPLSKEELGLIRGVGEELDNLSDMLSTIQCVLADAEERQITEKAVQNWLARLKNVAYDADDVLDEFAYEALRRKLMDADETKGQVCKHFFLSCCLLSPIRFRRNLALRIKEINKRVKRISLDREGLHLKKGDGEIPRNLCHDQRPPSSSLVPKNFQSDFVGRDDDIERIMDLLISDEHASGGGGKDVSVISIVGMGGLGKTTLAQLVQNYENVQKHFQVRAWVCVSDDFDISRLTKEIIESATGKSYEESTFNLMQHDLRDILSGKRFLIVLDDVWNTERNTWDWLLRPSSYGAEGSKIIVTTRDEDESITLGADHIYRLGVLSHKDCLSLFRQRAFVGENRNAHLDDQLMEIGNDLVKRHCRGLPLAAKALGDLLSSRREIKFWESILNSQLWGPVEGVSEVMKALRVSYHHLPPHIKQCFAFCSIFPKDHKFKKDELVELWMAQGFIRPPTQGMMTPFDFMLSRSFFQWSEDEDCYKMHDCIHDLAMLVSSDECFRFEHDKPTLFPAKGHRHLSFLVDKDIKTEDVRHLYECKGLRTFILQARWMIERDMNQVFSDFFVNLRCLRVLVLEKSGITKLPGSISNLKHLRYLSLSWIVITQLPESVSSLYNLQTLKLSHCYKLSQLPKGTRELVNLRHLNLHGCSSLKSIPPEMGKLSNLQKLSKFIVGRERGCEIGQLKGLEELTGAISIKNLHNVLNAKEAEEINLKYKTNIEKLRLKWVDEDDDDEDAANTNLQRDQASVEELGKILEALRPHTNIKSLSMKGYGGNNYPSWLQHTMLPYLEYFKIQQCTKCNSIPPLGQFCMLKNICIQGIPGVKCIGHEFYRDGEIERFPSLETLDIAFMDDLEEWCEPEEGRFLSVQSLTIAFCDKLTKIPNDLSRLHITRLCFSYCPNIKSLPKGLWNLTSLEVLTINSCSQLLSLPEEGLPTSLRKLVIILCPELRERCRKGDGEDWAKISHIPWIEFR